LAVYAVRRRGAGEFYRLGGRKRTTVL